MSSIKVKDFHPEVAQGVSQRQASVIKKSLEQGRQHFGRPAASLTQLDDPRLKGQLPEGWKREVLEIAQKGEEETSRLLAEWVKDKPNAVYIDSVHIKGYGKEEVDPETGLIEAGDTDHILIVGAHVLVIDSKKWKEGKSEDKKIIYAQNDKSEVIRFGKPFPGGKVHIASAIHMWFDYLSKGTTDDEKPNLLGMIHIVSDFVEVQKYKNWWETLKRKYWYLIEKSEFKNQLDKWYERIPDEEKTFISTDIVSEVVVCSCRPYDRRAHVINMKPLHGGL